MIREIKVRIWNVEHSKMWEWETMVRNGIFALDAELPSKENFIAIPKQDEKHIWLQFTGLKDKNGKEIFEGDVVKWSRMDLDTSQLEDSIIHSGGIGYIEWSNELAMFSFAKVGKIGCFQLEDNTYEIIGNIYENPELLKK